MATSRQAGLFEGGSSRPRAVAWFGNDDLLRGSLGYLLRWLVGVLAGQKHKQPKACSAVSHRFR